MPYGDIRCRFAGYCFFATLMLTMPYAFDTATPMSRAARESAFVASAAASHVVILRARALMLMPILFRFADITLSQQNTRCDATDCFFSAMPAAARRYESHNCHISLMLMPPLTITLRHADAAAAIIISPYLIFTPFCRFSPFSATATGAAADYATLS